MRSFIALLIFACPVLADAKSEAIARMRMAAAAEKARQELLQKPTPPPRPQKPQLPKPKDKYRLDLSKVPEGENFYVRDGVWHRPERMEILKPGNHWHIGTAEDGSKVVMQHSNINFGDVRAHTDPSGVVRGMQSESPFDEPFVPVQQAPVRYFQPARP